MSFIAVNHNSVAASAVSGLLAHSQALAVSTRRLSSGLRINSAADDAAGLAIRELMRSDIAALRQGVRNVNDAISLLQTTDGALGVIDEKLIRMKELAEQAATGTYDSTQRQMIHEEWVAMGEEINRIARATDFNGIKLLDGVYGTALVQTGTEIKKVKTATEATATAFTASMGGTISPTAQALAPEAFASWLPNGAEGPVSAAPRTISLDADLTWKADDKTESKGSEGFNYNITFNPGGGGELTDYRVVYEEGQWAVKTTGGAEIGNAQNTVTGDGFAVIIITRDTGVNTVTVDMVSYKGDPVGNLNDLGKEEAGYTTKLILDPASNSYTRSYDLIPPDVDVSSTDAAVSYDARTGTITATPKGGGEISFNYTPAANADDEEISFQVTVKGKIETKEVPIYEPEEDSRVRIHFGTGNDSAEDYYDIRKHDATLKGLGLEGVGIQTQDQAQHALTTVNDAIVAKDRIRAEYGAMQNRLENTMTSLTIQAENLQAAESRLSDADIAAEMSSFVRSQILTRSAVAMLAQANSLPQMVMSLLQ